MQNTPSFKTLRSLWESTEAQLTKQVSFLLPQLDLLFACVALWSAIGAMMDGRKAVRIAEWTARKDYWEFCETIEDQEDGYDRVTKAPLGPPPHTFSGDNQQNGLLAGEAGELLPAQSPGTGALHAERFLAVGWKLVLTSSPLQPLSFTPNGHRNDLGPHKRRLPSPVQSRLLPSIPAAIWPLDLPLIQASTPMPGFSCRICKATLKLGFDEPPEHPWDHNNCYFVSWCWSCIDEALYGLYYQRVDSPPRGMVLHINDILRINAETTDDGGEVDNVLTQISWQRNFNQVVEALLYRVYFVYNGDEKHGGAPYPDDGSKSAWLSLG
ncbi:hypothetical protein QC762_601035 [Podospora pseudocomata]|uniref:Uncharacterized protein n=1 Tax=Podospora pseudocomata TaxID=2093779 RepID=A0ABR0G7I7_9PEZI|nr:hypothetical protein QC762_601035 [Podospora pseudocomata]